MKLESRADARDAEARTIPAQPAVAQSVRVPVSFHGKPGDSDVVSIEEPMEIRLDCPGEGGERSEMSLAVTMRTPGDDFDLAIGFLFTEGVISGRRDVTAMEHCGPPSPDKGLRNVVKARLADHVSFDAGRLTRHFFTSSSCGVCGKASLDAVRVQLPAGERRPAPLAADRLLRLPQALRRKQVEFERTGGLHASACFDEDGRILRLREDVGRHNALDKLIGSYLEREASPLAGRGILLSGRASFELIQKAAMTGAHCVAAIGPPSSLAVELAVETGITLIGFLKSGSFNVYANAGLLSG